MSVLTPPSVPTKRLAVALLSTDTSFVLEDILSWDGANDLTPASFGTGNPPYALGCLRSADNAQIEFFWFNPANVADGAIPFGARGLSYSGGLAAGAATQYAWPAYTTLVELGSNVPPLFSLIGFLGNDQAWTGANQFAANPTKGAATLAPTNDSYVTKYDLIAAALGTLNTNQVVIGGTSDTALAAGNVVYLKTSNQRWALADQATSATYTQVVLGVVQSAAASSGLPVNVLLYGEDANQSGMTPGSFYYLGTSGAIAATAGATYEVSVGVAKSATVLEFSPLQKYEASSGTYAALAGDDASVAIGSGNRFVTQTGRQLAPEVSGTLGGSASAYTLALSPVPAALAANLEVHAFVNTRNAGATTFTLNGLATKNVLKYGAQALVAGDMPAGMLADLKYDGTQWQLLNPATAPGIPPQTLGLPLQVDAIAGAGSSAIFAGATGLAGGLSLYHLLASSPSTSPTASVFLSLDTLANAVLPTLPAFSAATSTLPATGALTSGVLLGSFTYRFGNSSGTLTGEQYTASTGAAANAVVFSGSPGATSNSPTAAFTDGTFIYIWLSAGTWGKFSVSGHTLTYVSSITYTGMPNTSQPWCDGASVYAYGNSAEIGKWALAGGSETVYAGTASVAYPDASQTYVVGASASWLAVIVYHAVAGLGASATASTHLTVAYVPKF